MEYYVISFSNTHGAIATEKYLKEEFKIVIMPTPREISRGCGIGIKFATEDYNSIIKKLDTFSLKKELYSIYRFTDGCYEKVH
ncbi:MAG: DUF3343 domain-containing protein [Anaerovoracaceae bacterium]|jgi:hypothetical protein